MLLMQRFLFFKVSHQQHKLSQFFLCLVHAFLLLLTSETQCLTLATNV